MEFHVIHEIAAPLARVEAAVLDPALLRRLPAFAAVILAARELTRHDHGDRVERTALYSAASVPAPLRAVIPPAWASWVERSTWDRRAHAASFSIEPQIPRALRPRVVCRGCYELRALAADRTLRSITGALQIAVPGVGRAAEAILVRVITRQFAGEAALLRALTGSEA